MTSIFHTKTYQFSYKNLSFPGQHTDKTILFAEDLHNYVNKLLFTFTQNTNQLDQFRPFIPHLKGHARKEYIAHTAPEYS